MESSTSERSFCRAACIDEDIEALPYNKNNPNVPITATEFLYRSINDAAASGARQPVPMPGRNM